MIFLSETLIHLPQIQIRLLELHTNNNNNDPHPFSAKITKPTQNKKSTKSSHTVYSLFGFFFRLFLLVFSFRDCTFISMLSWLLLLLEEAT